MKIYIKRNNFSNYEELETSGIECETDLVKSKVRGQKLHVTESKEVLKVNNQNRHCTIDT